MLQRLVANTLVSGVAFTITGVIQLLLVPLLVHEYGIEQYGLLVLVRLLLPTGILAMLDLGNSETASYAVAKGRHDSDWSRCGRYLGGLWMVAALVGIFAGVSMSLLIPAFQWLFSVPSSLTDGFQEVVLITALAFPILLVSLIAEGVVKGFEEFKKLRTMEVTATLIYAAVTLSVIRMDLPFQWAAFAFLTYGASKAAFISVVAAKMLRSKGTILRLPTRDEWIDLRIRCVPLGLNRTIGVAQVQAAPALIAVMLGTAAVGLYDLVIRIPRFLKVVTGVLSSAVLPMVLRMDQSGDNAGIDRLFQLGLLGVLALVSPIVAWGICFSEAILRLWLSEDYASLWGWQALMFAWPLVNAVTSFTCGALLGRPHFVSALNRIVAGQILVQISLSVVLVPAFAEQAFVVGQVVALYASLPLQLGLVASECGLRLGAFSRPSLMVATLGLATAMGLSIDVSSMVDNSLQLLISMAGWLMTSALIIGAAFLTGPERRSLLSICVSRTK